MSLKVSITVDTQVMQQGFNKAAALAKNFSDTTTKGFSSLKKGVSQVGNTIQAGFVAGSQAAKNFAASMAVPAAAVGLFARNLVNSTSEFESGMRRAAALSVSEGETVEGVYASLRKAAMDMAKDSVFSTSEVAEAMAELGAAGFNTKRVIDAMPGVIAAAAASGEGLNSVVGLMTAALSVFGEKAGGAEHIADVLAMAANKSKASVMDMTYAFQYAAPQANLLGVSLEELSAMTAILSDSGMQASNIGTGLRSVFMNLTDLTSEAKATLKELGVETLDAQNNFRPMVDIIKDLNVAMTNKTSTEKSMIATQLVGKVAANTLIGLTEAGHDKLVELTQALKKSDGASKESADNMLKGWAGAMKKMSSAFDVFKQELMTTLGPVLEKVADAISGALNWFSELPESLKTTIATVGAVVGAIVVLAPIVGTVVSAVLGAFSLLNAPFIALAGLVALIGFNFEGLQDSASGVQGRFSALVEQIIPFFERIKNSMLGINEAFQPTFNALINGVMALFEATAPVFANLIDGVMQFIHILSDMLAPVFTAIIDIFTEAWSELMPLFNWVIDTAKENMEAFAPTLKQLGEMVGNLLSGIWDLVKVVLHSLKPAFEIFGAIAKGVVQAVIFVFNGLADTISAVGEFITSVIEGISNSIRFVTDMAQGIGNFFGGFFGGNAEIGENANGTNHWKGGLTWVNERGGEIMNLPRGTQIIPHDVSMRYAETAAKELIVSGEKHPESNKFYIELKNVTIYDQRDIETLSREIAYELDKRMA